MVLGDLIMFGYENIITHKKHKSWFFKTPKILINNPLPPMNNKIFYHYDKFKIKSMTEIITQATNFHTNITKMYAVKNFLQRIHTQCTGIIFRIFCNF